MIISDLERNLCRELRDFPRRFNNRYGPEAKRRLLQVLFWSLVNYNTAYLGILFRKAQLPEGEDWILRNYQGADDGAEYTPFARGKPCGHIFKSGEATYRCKTCTLDDTCVLCSRCFESSDHTGHIVYVSISPGNSGCCDCGDLEAWKIPVNCAIHTADGKQDGNEKAAQASGVPEDLAESIRTTIGRALDYLCDIVSCSPEQLRLAKSEESIIKDEIDSRLTSAWYEDGDTVEANPEYALVLWNDEKHSVQEVTNQVSRACKKEMSFGHQKARETDDIGRSVVTYSHDLGKLLKAATVIEKIKITVTIRSARDTFREQMCSTIIEWLLDIVGCSVGSDGEILKKTVCKEMLKPWRTGSRASNADVGKSGIDDHEIDESRRERTMFAGRTIHDIQVAPGGGLAVTVLPTTTQTNNGNINDEGDDDDDDVSQNRDPDMDDLMDLDLDLGSSDADGDMDVRHTGERSPDDDLEVSEATLAGYPPPPPPPPPPAQTIHGIARSRRATTGGLQSSMASGSTQSTPRAVVPVPKTPYSHSRHSRASQPPDYWEDVPQVLRSNLPVAEDVSQRVRLDWMILFDLRLWKKARVDLRDLYISTVVTVPEFKRVLGLRFAGLYTVLAQLYLIADREPDHSIIYLSLQMLTTPSITQEVVEKGNFLTNLIAILYTFLTTRQVGHPWEVSANATLAFDAGSVTNRRMYHFFMDLKHLFASEYVQQQLRQNKRYILQFMDLIKLPQGICPNVRAIGEHVEYETDAWISASLLTRELNRLCRQFSDAFKWRRGEDEQSVSDMIRTFARATVINSIGAERKRFDQAEIKSEIRFKDMSALGDGIENAPFRSKDAEALRVVDFVVEKEPISFHHALHYTLSWLIDGAKSMDVQTIRGLMQFAPAELIKGLPNSQYRSNIPLLEPESYLMALFDYPLRVCAWLAQMKAGMWVRNGLSLRHQMSTYRGVAQRDLAHQRDIFLLQTALVTCNPSRVLLSMVDRFGMDDWLISRFAAKKGYEDTQQLDVVEDFVHLLIVLLIERTSLHPIEDEPCPQALAIRRDIAHILCFKPLSFSELCSRLADKFQDLDEFQDILEEMTTFKAPEGLSDTGTFELKQEYLSEIDPYILHYTKNQRDEAETAYRNWVSKKTGKPAADVVLEPKIQPIKSGIFKNLSEFTRTAVFAQVISSSLRWALNAQKYSRDIPVTRVEAFLQVVLHLILAAVLEDHSNEFFEPPTSSHFNVEPALVGKSFIFRLLFESPFESDSIFLSLQSILARDDLASCHPKTRLILLRTQQRQPQSFLKLTASRGMTIERLGSDSPTAISVEDMEAKKKQAQDRQAKVMRQFQKQQQDFLLKQSSMDLGEDELDDSESMATGQEEHTQMWKYPSGNCILCQEETNDDRLYGTFALLTQSRILRQTDMEDADYLREVIETPESLDRSAEAIRPFGVGGQNRFPVRKITSDGLEIIGERQGLGKGFNPASCREGPVSTGCGHIMHYKCFELYSTATVRRQTHQIARNHPERLDHLEFVCPLCKALGNAFLPIIWRGKEESYPGVLQTELSYDSWLNSHIGVLASRYNKHPERGPSMNARQQEVFAGTISETIIASSAKAVGISSDNEPGPTSPIRTAVHHIPGGYPDEVSPTRMTSSDNYPLEELTSIYRRIRDTIKANKLPSRFATDNPADPIDLINTDVLATTLGLSISATEIAQRGVESEPGSIFLDKISPLTLTHLRILSETASSYIAIGGRRASGQNQPSKEFLRTHSFQLLQLFAGHPQMYEENAWAAPTSAYMWIPAALSEDTFVLLTEASIALVPALRLDIHHIIQTCYLLEVVKTILSIHSTKILMTWSELAAPGAKSQVDPETLAEFRQMLAFMEQSCDLATPLSQSEPQALAQLYAVVATYALVFLRKSAVLLHVRYGVDFPNTGYSDMGEPEIDRLSKALRLPSLTQLFKLVNTGSSFRKRTVIQSMVSAWISHWRWMLQKNESFGEAAMKGIRPSHPAIFELIGLPKYYDTLLDEMMRRRCPTTKKDLVEPAICLFCGEIFCSQAVCCSVDGLGGCSQHMKK